MLNVCDVIGTEQRSMKAKMTSLQVQMDSVGVSRPGKCRMPDAPFLMEFYMHVAHVKLSAMTISATVRQSIAGLRRKLHTRAADTMPHKKESCTYKKITATSLNTFHLRILWVFPIVNQSTSK